MDPQELQEKIALYYSKLPPEAQAIFSKMEWLETLRTISVRHSLSDAQIQTLGTETTLILLGIIHFNEYEANLEKELGLPKESVVKILGEINEAVLKPIRPQL